MFGCAVVVGLDNGKINTVQLYNQFFFDNRYSSPGYTKQLQRYYRFTNTCLIWIQALRFGFSFLIVENLSWKFLFYSPVPPGAQYMQYLTLGMKVIAAACLGFEGFPKQAMARGLQRLTCPPSLYIPLAIAWLGKCPQLRQVTVMKQTSPSQLLLD